MTTIAKDLTKEAPRSPRIRLGGYAIIARTIDKGHAHLAGTTGDYRYEKREWFQGELARLNLDLENTPLFDWLEIDDKASFAK